MRLKTSCSSALKVEFVELFALLEGYIGFTYLLLTAPIMSLSV